MEAFRVGTRNRIKLVEVPRCSCGETSIVSIPNGAITKHRCIEHIKNRKVRDEALLRKFGLI
jgi:hypothetical protein